MTDIEIKVAIAGACGVPTEQLDICQCGDGYKHHSLEHAFTPMMTLKDIPDYPNDLNAMHEAEEILTPQGQKDFADALMHAAMFEVNETDENGEPCIPEVDCDYFKMVHTTARDRAEAFLKTLGKWQDSEPSNSPEPKGTEVTCKD